MKFKGFILYFIWISTSISAQNFNHSPNDTFIGNAVMNDGNVFNIFQIHTTIDTLNFKWKKLSVQIPSTWEASICDLGHCYTSIVDSSTMDPVFVGDNGLMSIHLNPHFEAGVGIIKVVLWEIKTPSKSDTLTWIITTKAASFIHSISKENAIYIYPNPAHESINIQSEFKNDFEYNISDMQGRIVFQAHSKSENLTQNLSSFLNGNYILTINNNTQIQFTINH